MRGKSAITSWGPAAWTLMHTVSFTYPDAPNEQDKQRAFDFMHAVAAMLPCLRCRRDWVHYLSQHLNDVTTSHLESREAFARFLVTGHNYVNEKLRKPLFDYETVQRMYDTNISAAPSTTMRGLWITMIVVVSVSLLIIFSRRCVLRRQATALPSSA